jgi:hypothetical protein
MSLIVDALSLVEVCLVMLVFKWYLEHGRHLVPVAGLNLHTWVYLRQLGGKHFMQD